MVPDYIILVAGEPRLPGAASLGKSLGRLSSMLPRRRPDNAGQDASDEDCEDDGAFASQPPLAKTRSISKVWLRIITSLFCWYVCESKAARLALCRAAATTCQLYSAEPT